ncbi:MAG: sugar transferase [Kiritimatiellia bacterium]
MIKRGFDIMTAVVGLLVLSPVLGLVALLVRFCMGPPVLFRQERPGYKERSFTLLKFRTMKDTGRAGGNIPDQQQRITKLGGMLRRLSLDELPELWNVLKGDMSIVGPRPLLMQYLDLYSPRQRRRHEMKPGITGWAQVNGRNAITWEQKFEYDVWYVDNWSLLLDLKIVMLTIFRVLSGKGVSAEGHATMPEFQGSTPNEDEKNGTVKSSIKNG